MGRAPALLSLRSAAVVALAIGLGVYYATSSSLWHASEWWNVLFISFVLMPAVFALVYLALPYRTWKGIGPVGAALLVLAFVLGQVDLETLANFSKLAGMTFIGFWFLEFFETVAWVVLVAFIVPWVDAYSVWRGPTNHIVEHHAGTFSLLSFAFPVPGHDYGANLGLPDLLFFAVFLGSADRFGLRVRLTWLLLVLFLGLTLVLTVAFDLNGLPALPFLSAGFLLANCDLLWRELRDARR